MIKAFIELARYNGYYDECKKLFEYIKNSEENVLISFPDFLSDYDCNCLIRVLWSILSIKYGDYGTSPRFGWLHRDEIKGILAEFEEAFRIYDGGDEDEKHKNGKRTYF